MKILYIQYTNPACYPPLERSSRMLADSGWQVTFLGTRVRGVESLEFPPHVNIRVRQMASCRLGWLRKLHYAAFCIWVCAWVLLWRPGWVYASELLSCPVALLLCWMPGVRFLYHEHDSPGQNSKASGVLNRLAFRARSSLAARAAACILPNQQRAERFRSEVPCARQILCIPNYPSSEEIRPRRATSTAGSLTLYYHGNIGRDYVPAEVIQSLKELPGEIRLRVIGYETAGTGGYVEYLRGLARASGVEDRVDFLPPVPHYELLKHCSGGDIGLAIVPLQSSDMNQVFKVGAANKVSEYLACGLAVLVSDIPDWKAAYVDAGYGLSCIPDQAESIAAALRWFFEHREETREMGERGRCRIASEWNYERQFTPVLDLLRNHSPAQM